MSGRLPFNGARRPAGYPSRAQRGAAQEGNHGGIAPAASHQSGGLRPVPLRAQALLPLLGRAPVAAHATGQQRRQRRAAVAQPLGENAGMVQAFVIARRFERRAQAPHQPLDALAHPVPRRRAGQGIAGTGVHAALPLRGQRPAMQPVLPGQQRGAHGGPMECGARLRAGLVCGGIQRGLRGSPGGGLPRAALRVVRGQRRQRLGARHIQVA